MKIPLKEKRERERELGINLSYDPAVPLLGIYPESESHSVMFDSLQSHGL